ncbi:MAG: hypothetical protein ABI072_06335, partial [Edaphobacter sp.]
MSDQPEPLPTTLRPSIPRPFASDDPGAAAPPIFPLPTGAEDLTAMLLPQGPIPTPDDYTPRRIPHLGHAALFVANTGLILLLAQSLFLAFSHAPHPEPTGAHTITSTLQPKLLVASMAISYVITLIASYFFFPLLWHRSFSEGIRWNLSAARRNAFKLIPLGLVLGFTVQAISSLIPVPKSIPMDNFFRTPSDVWLVTLFGTLLAPAFE